MNTKSKILDIIEKNKRWSTKTSQTSNLFLDLGFDSLAYVKLLVEIESSFGIVFEFSEMENCLNVNKLVSTVEQKVKKISKEKGSVSTTSKKPKKAK